MNFTTFFKAVSHEPLDLKQARTCQSRVACRNRMFFTNVITRTNITALIIAITLTQANAAVYTHNISSVKRNAAITSSDLLTVNGKVSDERGQSLPGVSVKIKGTATGTVTDSSGNYTIKANNGDVLIFSFIGFV